MTEDSAGLLPIGTGTASTVAQAWSLAFAAGRAALLNGTIRDLAIAVDDEIPTFGYSPGRDRHDRVDPDRVAESLDGLLADILRDLPQPKPGST